MVIEKATDWHLATKKDSLTAKLMDFLMDSPKVKLTDLSTAKLMD